MRFLLSQQAEVLYSMYDLSSLPGCVKWWYIYMLSVEDCANTWLTWTQRRERHCSKSAGRYIPVTPPPSPPPLPFLPSPPPLPFLPSPPPLPSSLLQSRNNVEG